MKTDVRTRYDFFGVNWFDKHTLTKLEVMNKIGHFFRHQTRPLSSSIGKFMSPQDFKPKKALVVSKVSRYEFERSKFSELSENEFEDLLTKRGSDYTMIK